MLEPCVHSFKQAPLIARSATLLRTFYLGVMSFAVFLVLACYMVNNSGFITWNITSSKSGLEFVECHHDSLSFSDSSSVEILDDTPLIH